MIKDSKNTQVHISVNSDDVKRFQQLYPQCLTRYVRNCISQALNSPEIFQKIFFSDIGVKK